MLKWLAKLKKIFETLMIMAQIIKAIMEAIDPPTDPDDTN